MTDPDGCAGAGNRHRSFGRHAPSPATGPLGQASCTTAVRQGGEVRPFYTPRIVVWFRLPVGICDAACGGGLGLRRVGGGGLVWFGLVQQWLVRGDWLGWFGWLGRGGGGVGGAEFGVGDEVEVFAYFVIDSAQRVQRRSRVQIVYSVEQS